MRVYHERLRVPLSWWLIGLVVIVILGAELAAGFGWLAGGAIYAVLVAGWAAMLLSWGWPRVEVADGELSVGRARLALAAVGEVSALDRAQTRVMSGPRADPAAFLLIRPYLREAVYVEVTEPTVGTVRRRRLRWRRWRLYAEVTGPAVGTPYWLVGTRHPAELAAAISRSRPGARADGAAVG
jgi:Protein of unknown function (DUF3093)